MPKIVLLGYMGAGKTAVGRALSALLEWSYLDLDDVIEREQGLSVTEIFAKKGEIAFRKAEHQTLVDTLAQTGNLVLSLGGGTPCYSNNHLLLQREDVLSVYLKTGLETLMGRLAHERAKRPLIVGLGQAELRDFIAQSLFERSYFYHFAKHSVVTDEKSVEAIASEIKALI